MKRLLVLGSLLAMLSTAHAQTDAGPAPATADADADDRRWTVMWAPIRLVVPLVEFTAEYRVQDKIGVSILAGAGKRTIESNMAEVTGTEIEGGVQGRYYVLGDFTHGLQVGAEALYEHVAFEEPLPPGILAVAAGGLTIGPFVGYKVVTRIGFTFEGQLGARYVAVEPPVTGAAGSMPVLDSKWLPLLHLNVGWTF